MLYEGLGFTALHINLFPGLLAPCWILGLPEQLISPLSYREGPHDLLLLELLLLFCIPVEH